MRMDRPADASPVHVFEGPGDSRMLVTCDHATNRVPPEIGGGSLGVAAGDMERHIAYDIGALGVSRALAARMGATLVASDFSRLVIDPNRGEDDPTLVMRVYDGTVIPANKTIDAAGRRARIDRYWRPYHDRVAEVARRRADTAIVAVHSFTPQLLGRAPRPWHVGILFPTTAPAFGLATIERLKLETGLVVGVNQPYPGDLPGDSIDRHALAAGRPGVLIEIRNDLIETADRQEAWAARLAPVLDAALADADI